MPTTTRVAKRVLMNYTSAGADQLASIIKLYFRKDVPVLGEMNVPDLFCRVDEKGFHVSGRLDGGDLAPSDDAPWERRPQFIREETFRFTLPCVWARLTATCFELMVGLAFHVEGLAEEVEVWLNDLDYDTARRICGSMPTEEAYTRDPGLSLTGFTARSGLSEDPKHRVLTIVPAWV